MGLGLIVHEKEGEIPIFKIGDLQGIVKVYLSLETGKWNYVNASITGKLRQKNDEGEEYSIEISRKDLSIEIRDQDSLAKIKEEVDEAIETMKEALRELENKIIKGKEFIDSYILSIAT